MRFPCWSAVFALSLLFSGCGHIFHGPVVDGTPERIAQAQSLISGIKARSYALDTVKGIGRITYRNADAVQGSRAAWLAAPDGRIRIEMLGPTGHAVAKFIFDGKTYAYISHLDQQVYTYSGSDLNLGPITGVAVPAADMVYFLAGAVPLRDYDHIDLITEDESGRRILVLKKRWHGTVQKIYPDMDGHLVARVDFFNRWGRLAYRADLGRFRQVDGRQIPFSIHVSDGDENGLRIEVDKCWTGFPLGPEMFSITPIQAESPRL